MPRPASRRWPRKRPRGSRISECSTGDAAKTVKLDPEVTVAIELHRRMRTRRNPSADRSAPRRAAVDPQFVELFIEEAKEEIASIQRSFPMWDRNPMDLESLAHDAAKLSYVEGQRPHGRRPLDRRIRVVNREFAVSDHRLNAVAHAGLDGTAAKRSRSAAAAGRTVGNRQTQRGSRSMAISWPAPLPTRTAAKPAWSPQPAGVANFDRKTEVRAGGCPRRRATSIESGGCLLRICRTSPWNSMRQYPSPWRVALQNSTRWRQLSAAVARCRAYRLEMFRRRY